MTLEEIEKMFAREHELKDSYKAMAVLLYNVLPEGRHKSIALTKLQESFFFASAE